MSNYFFYEEVVSRSTPLPDDPKMPLPDDPKMPLPDDIKMPDSTEMTTKITGETIKTIPVDKQTPTDTTSAVPSIPINTTLINYGPDPSTTKLVNRSYMQSYADVFSSPSPVRLPFNEQKAGISVGGLDNYSSNISIPLIVFLVFWGIGGLAGFICSFVCLGYDGDSSIKIGGIILSLFLGPFYWIYFGVLRSQNKYCIPPVKK